MSPTSPCRIGQTPNDAQQSTGRLPQNLSTSHIELTGITGSQEIETPNRQLWDAMLNGNQVGVEAIMRRSPSERPTPHTVEEVTLTAFGKGMHYAEALVANIPDGVAKKLQRIRSIAEFLRELVTSPPLTSLRNKQVVNLGER